MWSKRTSVLKGVRKEWDIHSSGSLITGPFHLPSDQSSRSMWAAHGVAPQVHMTSGDTCWEWQQPTRWSHRYVCQASNLPTAKRVVALLFVWFKAMLQRNLVARYMWVLPDTRQSRTSEVSLIWPQQNQSDILNVDSDGDYGSGLHLNKISHHKIL